MDEAVNEVCAIIDRSLLAVLSSLTPSMHWIQAKQEEDRCEMLIWASARGLLSDATAIIALGTRVNCKDKRGLSPLHYASSHGRDEVMECLLVRGADIDAESQTGRMPIHYACAAGRDKAVKLILSKKAWADPIDSMDDTPLHLAARRGDASICQLLLVEGKSKSIEMRNKRGLTPLGESVVGGHIEATEVLIDQGARVEVEAQGYNILHLAAGLGYHEPIHALFNSKGSKQKGVSLVGGLVNKPSSGKEAIFPLHAAVMSLSVDTVEVLLKIGADPGSINSSGQTPLDLLNWNAVKRGNEKDEDIEEIKSLLTSAMSKRPKKQPQPQVRPTAVKDEPVVLTFEALPRQDQVKKVEALSQHPDISSLSHHDESARKALTELSRASKLLESLRAVAALRYDEEYQKDVLSEHVKTAMMDIQQTNDMSKYRDDLAVMQVCSKLNKLQALLRSNGSLPPSVSILQETLVSKEGPNSLAETRRRIKTLESTVESLVDRCIVAMGGKSKEEHEREASNQFKAETVPEPSRQGDDKPASSSTARTTVEQSPFWSFLQRFGKDLLIQIAAASLMVVFALFWLSLAKKEDAA